MTKRERETRDLLREAAIRLPHGVAYTPGKRCPAPTCFRCRIEKFLRIGPFPRPARPRREGGET